MATFDVTFSFPSALALQRIVNAFCVIDNFTGTNQQKMAHWKQMIIAYNLNIVKQIEGDADAIAAKLTRSTEIDSSLIIT